MHAVSTLMLCTLHSSHVSKQQWLLWCAADISMLLEANVSIHWQSWQIGNTNGMNDRITIVGMEAVVEHLSLASIIMWARLLQLRLVSDSDQDYDYHHDSYIYIIYNN